MKKSIFWILINYNSCSDIHKLIKIHKGDFKFIIVDNSKNYVKCKNEEIISPGLNVGYIGGFKLALKSINNHSKLKIIFSNSDIKVVDGFREVLESDVNVGDVIIPRIISPKGEQNPHILDRKNKFYWLVRYIASRNNIFWYLWNSLGAFKLYFTRKPKKLTSTEKVYAGHGSFFIFNCIDFSDFIIDSHNFLYGEEVHLAEFFFIKRITVFFNPTFIIHHNEHTSTSLLKNSIRRSLFNDSYKSILSKYYK